MPIDSAYPNDDPRGFRTDTDGRTPEDPRGYRAHQRPHQRSLDDIDRAAYTDQDTPANGNRLRQGDARNKGALGNDLKTGRTRG